MPKPKLCAYLKCRKPFLSVKGAEHCSKTCAYKNRIKAAPIVKDPDVQKLVAYLESNKLKNQIRSLDWQKKNPKKARYRNIKHKYGLTLEQYDSLIAKGCAVCLTHRELCVDHDHETGVVRGVLCRKCNTAIGLMQDSPDNLFRAFEYLEKAKKCEQVESPHLAVPSTLECRTDTPEKT